MINRSQLKISLILFGVSLLLGYTFPLHIHPYRSYCNDALVILGLLLMLGCWSQAIRVTITIAWVVVLPLGLIVVILLQVWIGDILYPVDMIFPICYLLFFALALIAGSTIANEAWGLADLCLLLSWTFMASGALSVLIQHVQLLHQDLMPWIVSLNWNAPIRPFANLAQPNTLASTLCFALASVWYLYSQNKIRPHYALMLAVWLLWGLALTQSRIGWVIVPLFVAMLCLRRATGLVVSRWILNLFAGLYVGLVWYAPVFLHGCGGLAESVEAHAAQTGVRLVLWQQALAMSESHPWFGVGWFQYGRYQLAMAASFNPTEYSEYAHNLILNFAAEIGWPATLGLGGALVIWLIQCCKGREDNAQIRFVWLILIAIGVHSMVEYPLWYAMFLIPFGLLLGALRTASIGSVRCELHRSSLLALVVACVLAMNWVTFDYQRMKIGFEAIAHIQAGDKSYLPELARPELTLFSQFYDYFHMVEIPVTFNMPESDIQFVERMAARFGFPAVLSRAAIVVANHQRPEDALHLLVVAERTGGKGYEQVYNDWQAHAQTNPQVYGEIFKKMPKADRH